MIQKQIITIRLYIDDIDKGFMNLSPSITLDKVISWGKDAISGCSLSTNKWSGANNLFRRNEYEIFRNELIRMGLAVDKKHNQGLTLTCIGKLFFEYLVSGNYETSYEQVNECYQDNKKGFLYVVTNGAFYKIGVTVNPVRRMHDLQISSPERLSFISLIQTDDFEKLERKLHNMFNDKRMEGEWFNLDKKDLEYIATLNIQNINQNGKKQLGLPL